MKIKNLTRRTLILRRSGNRPSIAITPGEGKYPVSMKDDGDAARLIAMKCANLISYGPKETDDVRDTKTTAAGAGTDGNTDSIEGGISGQEAYTSGERGGVSKRRNKKN